jgi:hypothetical protein
MFDYWDPPGPWATQVVTELNFLLNNAQLHQTSLAVARHYTTLRCGSNFHNVRSGCLMALVLLCAITATSNSLPATEVGVLI